MTTSMLTSAVALLVLLTSSGATLAKGLSVYTSRKGHLVEGLFRKYTRQTGIPVHYKTASSGQLVQLLRHEGHRTRADILMTVDAGSLGFAAEEGLLQKLSSPILNKNVPPHLRGPEGRWFALSVRARALVINTRAVSPQIRLDYEDLARPLWKGRLCLRTSQKVYNQSLVAMLISEHGHDRALEIVRGWAQNAAHIMNSDRAVLLAVAQGRCHVGIINTYYMGRSHLAPKDSSVKIVWPNQDSYGVHLNISGAGVVKFSKNKKEAQKFLEWLSGQQAQRSFAQINWEYPILKGVANHPLVDSWGAFKASQFHLHSAHKKQQQAVKLMHQAGYR